MVFKLNTDPKKQKEPFLYIEWKCCLSNWAPWPQAVNMGTADLIPAVCRAIYGRLARSMCSSLQAIHGCSAVRLPHCIWLRVLWGCSNSLVSCGQSQAWIKTTAANSASSASCSSELFPKVFLQPVESFPRECWDCHLVTCLVRERFSCRRKLLLLDPSWQQAKKMSPY